MKILLTLFVLLFSSSVIAEDIKIECIYKDLDFEQKYKKSFFKEIAEINKVMGPTFKLLDELYMPLDLTMIIEYSNNNNWKIIKLNVSASKEFKEDQKRIYYNQEYNKRDKKFVKLLWALNPVPVEVTMKEFARDVKKIPIENYNERLEYFFNILEGFVNNTINYKKLFAETKIDSLNGEKLDGKIILKTVNDTGVLIRNKIEYPKILNEKEVDSILKTIDTRGDIILDVKGKCINANPNNNVNTTSQSNNDDDSINKLKKLKLMFENELITQDEYDAKRKEILDEM